MNKVFRVIWSQATQSWVAVSELTKAHKKQSSSTAKKSASSSSANLIKSSAIALALLSGHSAYAALNQPGTGGDVAVALGDGSNASGGGATVALGAGSKATGGDSFAVGWEATASATRSISIGNRSTANSGNSIALGSNTQARGDGSIAIGVNAKSNNDAEGTIVIGRDAFSEGSGNGTRPNTVVGRGAYTAFGEGGNYRLNASTALGFQAGAGVIVDPDNNRKLVRNNTNADNNAEVLVKAGYGIDDNAPAETKAALQAGSVHNGLVFYRKRHINEGTAIGVESRAVGDQSIAIGGQVVAGDGVVALGGNDSDALRDNKYQVVTDNAVRNTSVSTIDDYNLAYTESKNTVAGQYQKLVGRGMPGSYKSTYGQSGSVVIGMHAHSTTALGTAIGTNSVVRMGAFGATAIGAGSTVQPNAEAAVAIGMGSVANGAYSLAAGTASWAEYGDIALGYQAKASGKDGAIAMGRATNAQGDSSIMIGGANIESASKQSTNYEKANGQTIDKTVIEKINGQDITRKYSFAATTTTSGTVAEAYKELTGRDMNVSAIDFANISNKNGHASTSLGVHSLAKGNLATAIGAGSRADAIGSVALGVGAQATRQNAVAIGTGSTTDFVGTRQLSVNYDSDGNIVSDDSKDIAYTFKWAGGIDTSEGDVVSFGSSGAERQLKNVAAGRVAEDSTDAINGSQLNSITKRIAAGFKTSGNVVTDSSGVFTSKKANTDSEKKDYETAIRSEDKVQLQVGNNLKLDRDETETEIDVRDDFDKTKIVKKKIKKADFAYSLNPVLTNLTSAEFKGTDENAPTTKLTNDGVKITPVTAGKNPVSLTQNGLNNGGNAITNVAGNLKGAEKDTTAPTTEAAKPENEGSIKNNAATVGDVLNAGWNLKEKGSAKDFVTAYDTVDFIDGEGTSVSVETAGNKTSTIKYSVKAADKSVEVSNAGVKVKTDGDTLTTGDNGLKVNTGSINTTAVPTVASGDENKIATVGNVAEAIKAAAWKATSAATANGENTGAKDQDVKAGDTVTFEADKNIKITQAEGKFTFATKDDVKFNSVQLGGDNGPKLTKTDGNDLKVSGSNGTDPVKITNVANGNISADSKDAINGSQFNAVANNSIKLGGDNNSETASQNLNKDNGLKFNINGADGIETVASGDNVTVKINAETKAKIDSVGDKADKNLSNLTEEGKTKIKNLVAWKATAAKTNDGENGGDIKEQDVKAGDTVTFEADKNIKIAQDGSKFTFSTKDDVEFKSVKVGEDKDGKKPVNLTTDKATDVSNNDPANKPTTALNVSSDGKPTQITGVGSVLNTDSVPTIPAGTATNADQQPKLVNLGTAHGQTPLSPNVLNSAATVRDLANMGWKISSDKATGADGKDYSDVVRNADEVKFVGKNAAKVSGKTENGVRTITVDVTVPETKTAELVSSKDGSVIAPSSDPALQKALKDAKDELAAAATPEQKEAAENKVKAAETALNNAVDNKGVATAKNVADMINASGFTLKTSATADGKKESGDDEVINPGKAVEMIAGKNLTVKQEANGKVTYSTKDNVEFTSVKVGEDKDGKKPVNFTTEAASPASNNGTDKTPTTALNISSSDGKPTQLKGVGSVLNTEAQPTSTGKQGDTPATAGNQNLVNLGNDPITGKSNLGSDILNSAATVGDLANMGWVVSTKDGNDYKDVVKNANQVDFKGGAGISVEGKTTTNGVREITISVKDGEVVKPNQFTAKVNGTDTPVTKVGDQYYNTADIDPKTGEPKANVTPVTPDEGTTPTNAGNGYVTGNKVAAAIQKSGFVVGKQKDALSAADFKDEVKDEKVNPDDELRFADGNNTKVKLATKESVDKDGNKVTTTTVKVDVTGLPVQYTDKNGTPVTKVGDKYFTVGDTATEVKPADLTTNMVNPAAAPNVIGAPTTLGNVKSNLPSVNDVGKDNKSAPITAEKAADIVNKAGNNAATVSDVLNAGWNLQNNGEARDFVKPYDTVNFINGKGTKAVVETADNLTSTVKFDVDAGEITADTTKPGAVKGPVTADEAKKLADDLKKAEQAVKDLPADATEDKKAEAQKALKDAQDAAAPLNKVATAQNVADMINASGFTLKTSAAAGGKKESGDDEIINPGKAVEMVAGKNLTVTQDKNGKVTYATANDVNFNSLSLGTSPHAPTLSADEDGSLRLGSKGNQAPVRISNVAPGIKDGDAVNVSQLKGVTKDLEDKIDGVAAGSNAAASLPQVYLPGKSMVAASVGTYGSQGALAVGYSSISDNGKWLIKGQVNVNTKAKTGGGVGVGYLW